MFTLSIDTDNAAFEGDAAAEVARILREVAARLERGDHGYSQTRSIMDANGNRVGSYKLVASAADRRGAPLSVGDHVEAGKGDDYDTGRIVSIDDDMAEVAWDSGVRTPCPVADLVKV